MRPRRTVLLADAVVTAREKGPFAWTVRFNDTKGNLMLLLQGIYCLGVRSQCLAEAFNVLRVIIVAARNVQTNTQANVFSECRRFGSRG